MEASVRIFNSTTNLNRHLSRSILITKHSLHFPPNRFPQNSIHQNNLLFSNRYASSSSIQSVYQTSLSSSSSSSLVPSPISNNPLKSFLSGTHFFNSFVSNEKFGRVSFESNEKNYFSWNRAVENVNGGKLRLMTDKEPVLAVVMLGWLGAEQKHLKRYIEMYTSKGIDAISFVVPVRDMLGFDLGRKVEKRILALSEELVSWLSKKEEDGRERGLLFHTFSNTGWFVYGAILDYFQSRSELMEKIKGCVIDSGGDPKIDPQVWAAGFSAALLKKRSSATLPSDQAIEGQELQPEKGSSKVHDAEPLLLETLVLVGLEKFFSFVLKMPDVNRRLTKIITTLSKNQPDCPQLYLYSTADKVIPFGQVEMFIQDQKMLGRKVHACNFGSSPHVDHFRNFPEKYSAELYEFLKVCVPVDHK